MQILLKSKCVILFNIAIVIITYKIFVIIFLEKEIFFKHMRSLLCKKFLNIIKNVILKLNKRKETKIKVKKTIQ